MENYGCEREILLWRYEDNFQKKSVDNEYSRIIKKLLDDASLIADVPEPYSGQIDELYVLMDEELDMWLEVPELSCNFRVQRYLDWQLEFHKVVSEAHAAYKTYRVTLREMLSV